MNIYRLRFDQTGHSFSFGAWNDSGARTIAGALLKGMLHNKGGRLTSEDGTQVGLWESDGAMIVQCGDMRVRAK